MTSPSEQTEARKITPSDAAAQTGSNVKLLPVFAALQRQLVATVRGQAIRELQDVHQAIAPNADHAPTESEREQTGGQQQPSEQYQSAPGLALTISRQDVEQGCRTVLMIVVGALFSDAQRTTVQTQSDEMLRSLTATTRKARPDASAMKEGRQEAERILDDLYDALFSDEVRNQTLQDGEKVIHTLLRGNIPNARREGEQALLALAERRGAILTSHWQQVFRSLMKPIVATSTKKEGDKEKGNSDSKTASSDESTMPQTIARSDKRAQSIWTKTYMRAAKEHGEGRRAERVAYESLKAEYEKKGDRWVKKSRQSEA